MTARPLKSPLLQLEELAGTLSDASFLAVRYGRDLSPEQRAEAMRLVDRIKDLEQIVRIWSDEVSR